MHGEGQALRSIVDKMANIRRAGSCMHEMQAMPVVNIDPIFRVDILLLCRFIVAVGLAHGLIFRSCYSFVGVLGRCSYV